MSLRAPALAVLLALAYCPPFVAQPTDPARSLNGTWEITALIDDGELLTPATLKATLVGDARLMIDGPVIRFARPGGGEERKLAFVCDPGTNPKRIDIAGSQRVGSRGIYLFDGDTFVVCLAGPGSELRPAEFSSPRGSHAILMTLKRVGTPTARQPAAAATPSPPAPPADRDKGYTDMLVGTWGHQDNDKVEMTTLNADGSFSATQNWKRGAHKLFQQDGRWSGTWKVQNGTLIFRVTAATDSNLRNQVLSYRISSLTATQLYYTDEKGWMRAEWKVR
jgi:uncharacterized protein (TIGR03067 family)